MFMVGKRKGVQVKISGASINGKSNQTMMITVADATCEEVKELIVAAIAARTREEVESGKYADIEKTRP